MQLSATYSPFPVSKYQTIQMGIASFSIIITSHNQANFIRDAVDSAVAQLHAPKEIIVVDDASSDGSQSILEDYGNTVRLIKLQNNVGAGSARNVGVEAAHGDFLVFLDGDDVLLPWALDAYRRILDSERAQIILSTMLWFEREAPKLSERMPEHVYAVAYETLLEKDRPYRASASALVINRDAFTKVQGWTNDAFPMDDLDALIKLFHSGRTVQVLAPPMVCYRIHPANSIHQVATCAAALRRIMKKEKRGGYPGGHMNRGRRYAFLGGPALFWMRKAYKNGLYREALRLLASGWPMIFAAGLRKLAVSVRGRSAVQTIAL
jgi:glycosyltransferase involved in cell wall biosynthesis